MSKISVIIIAKNEEKMIRDAILSAQFADEIIVIDSGSTDSTIDVARKLKTRVVEFSSSDFSELRNKGMQEASGNWIFYLDADERITEALQKKIKEITRTVPSKGAFTCYSVTRRNFYYGEYEWPYKEHLERLFFKTALKQWYGELHESPEFIGELGKIDECLDHFSHRDLKSMVEKTNKWSEVEAKLRFDAGHPQMEWWRFPRVMAGAFIDSYFLQKGFRLGVVGLIESLYQGFSIFITYIKLWEMQNKEKIEK